MATASFGEGGQFVSSGILAMTAFGLRLASYKPQYASSGAGRCPGIGP